MTSQLNQRWQEEKVSQSRWHRVECKFKASLKSKSKKAGSVKNADTEAEITDAAWGGTGKLCEVMRYYAMLTDDGKLVLLRNAFLKFAP